MIKMAEITFELVSHPDLYIFLEKSTKVKFLIFLIDTLKPRIDI